MNSAAADSEAPSYAELMGYSPVWFWVMIFTVLTVIFLGVFVILRTQTLLKEKKTAQQLMFVGFSGEIDKAFMMVSNNEISMQEACQRISIVLRSFIAQRTNIPANQMTLTDLKRSDAPPKLLQSIEYAYPIIFGGKKVTDYDEFLRYMNSSRAILDGWWV